MWRPEKHQKSIPFLQNPITSQNMGRNLHLKTNFPAIKFFFAKVFLLLRIF